MRRAILILMLLFLGACSTEQMIERMTTPRERAVAQQAVDALIAGDYEKFDEVIDPPLRDEMTPEAMKAAQPLMPKGKAALQGIFVETNAGKTHKSFTYHAGSGDRWAIIQITLRTAPGDVVVAGYRVWPQDHAPANNPGSATIGVVHYLWIVGMMVALGTTLTALVMVLRTRGLKLKWLWAIGCLFSFVKFELNWTTGDWVAEPFFFVLFGAGAIKAGPFGAWLLQFAIPVFAIIFLVCKARGAFDPDPEEEAEPFR